MPTEPSATPQSPDYRFTAAPREVSLLDLYRAIRSSWLMIFITALAFGALAGVLAYVMRPVYRATVVMIPADNGGGASALGGAGNRIAGLASMVGIDLGKGGQDPQEALAVLRSRAFTEKFIDDNHLLPIMYSSRWDARTKSWKLDDGEEVPSARRAFRKFDNDIRTVSQDDITGIVTVDVEWKDPKLAAAWANDLVSRLNEYMRARAITESRRSVEYLERELQHTSLVGVQDVINNLIENQINNIMLAEVRKEYSFRIIDPAAVPARDDFVRPKRFLMIVVALFLGGMLGIMIAAMRALSARATPHPSRLS